MIIGLVLLFNAVYFIPEMIVWEIKQLEPIPDSPWFCTNVVKPSDGLLYDYFIAFDVSFVPLTASVPQFFMIVSTCVMLYHLR